MKKIILIIIAVLFVGYAIFAIITFSGKPESELCKDVKIQVLDSAKIEFIKAKDVYVFLKKNDLIPTSKKIKDINTETIELKLKSIPIVETAECYHTPNGILCVDITQRSPILKVMGSSGDYYIDEEAKIIPTSSNFTVYLPIATGYIDSTFAKTSLHDLALYLKKNEFWNAQIEQIDVLPNKDVVLIPRVGDHQVLLGNLDGFEQKLDQLKTFYKEGLNETGWNKYTEINLKFDKQIICKKSSAK